jgi:hypothetical protein
MANERSNANAAKKSYYELLQVPRNASADDIRKAYIKQSVSLLLLFWNEKRSL